MLDKIKAFFEFAAKVGLNLPAAYDPDKPGPSVSLLFAHISFYVAIISICVLIYKDHIAGSIGAMTMAGVYFIFYMIRRITKAKFDLDDRSFDIENDEKESK